MRLISFAAIENFISLYNFLNSDGGPVGIVRLWIKSHVVISIIVFEVPVDETFVLPHAKCRGMYGHRLNQFSHRFLKTAVVLKPHVYERILDTIRHLL
jgi:hypothetical protein